MDLNIDVEQIPETLTGRPVWKASTTWNGKRYTVRDFRSASLAKTRLVDKVTKAGKS